MRESHFNFLRICLTVRFRYAAEQDTVLMLLQRVQEAQRIAIRELKDQDFDGKQVDSAAALEAEVVYDPTLSHFMF